MELMRHKIFVFLLFDDSKQGLTGEDQWGRGNKIMATGDSCSNRFYVHLKHYRRGFCCCL